MYADQFVLKGALLFRVWGLTASRPTHDIDLLGFTGNENEEPYRDYSGNM
jgi:Nucleotidyl transferase AbiEii toxin, Type IV TA system